MNTLHNEHLAAYNRPLFVALEEDRYSNYYHEQIIGILNNGIIVDYYGTPCCFEKNRIKGSPRRYGIAPINEKDKYSTRFKNCTSLVAVGRSKETGQHISTLSHQEPFSFLHHCHDDFNRDLSRTLQFLLQHSEEGSVDIGILGGNCFYGGWPNEETYAEMYEASILKLQEIVLRESGLDPVVLTGPNSQLQSEAHIFLDTQERRIFLQRAPQFHDRNNAAFLASEIREQVKAFQGSIEKESPAPLQKAA